MRCLHSIDLLRLEAGGVVRAVLDLVGGLAQQGVEVTLLTGDATDAPAEWKQTEQKQGASPGMPHVIEIDQRSGLFGGSAETREILRAEVSKADIVHLHTPWDRFNPVVASEANRQGKPYVVTIHGMLDDWCLAIKGIKKRIYLNLVARKILTQAARLHFTAGGERDQSMRHLGGGTPEILPLLLDLSQYQEAPRPETAREAFPELFQQARPDEPLVLFLGRIHSIKGLDVLIHATALVAEHGFKPKLVFAGPYEDSYREELQTQADQLGVGDQLVFLGMTHGEVKRSLYTACDLFVLPSHHENFGIALAEAMCSGMPVVTNKSVNIWPELQPFGAIIVEDEPHSLAQGLEQALGDLPQLQELARSNRQGVLDWLDPQRVCAQYVEMYERVIAE